MKIVLTDRDTVTKGDLNLCALSEFGEVVEYGLTSPDEITERIKDADIILCNKTPLNSSTLQTAEKLKYIGLFATGYNNIDLEYTAKKGIVVCNAPDYSTDSVAQHTFALILELYNHVYEYNKTVQNGDWVASSAFSYFPIPLTELFKKTIGIIGFGSIGKKVCEIANAFGMHVVVCTRTLRHSDKYNYIKFVSMDELLEQSDIVTLHCPLNDQTQGLMNQSAFDKMKPNAILINTARGAIVDENALLSALSENKIAGAGLDVICQEPMNKDCVLRNAPNCIITPHVAWAGIETRKRLLDIVVSNLRGFLTGNIQNKVN